MSSPSARNSAVEKSSASLTTNERAVRWIVRAISSASAASAFLTSSSANGSRTPASAGEAILRSTSTGRLIASLKLDFERVPRDPTRTAVGRHDGRAVELLDEQGSRLPFAKIVARDDRCRDESELRAEIDVAHTAGMHVGGHREAIRQALAHRGTGDHPHVDNFDRFIIRAVAVMTHVSGPERLAQHSNGLALSGRRKCKRQLGIRADVAQVQQSLETMPAA